MVTATGNGKHGCRGNVNGNGKASAGDGEYLRGLLISEGAQDAGPSTLWTFDSGPWTTDYRLDGTCCPWFVTDLWTFCGSLRKQWPVAAGGAKFNMPADEVGVLTQKILAYERQTALRGTAWLASEWGVISHPSALFNFFSRYSTQIITTTFYLLYNFSFTQKIHASYTNEV